VEKESVALGKEVDYTATSRKGANDLMVEDISREELKEKMGRGEDFVLLEVLPEKSYRQSHLPGAINLPPGQTDQAEELIPHKEAEVVVYCANPP
jgi:rhodanese-related sulfurtransferase